MISNKQTVPNVIQLACDLERDREAMNMEVILYIVSLGIRMNETNFDRIRIQFFNCHRTK